MNRREFTLKICQLVLEMAKDGLEPIFDYLLRSEAEQQRLFALGRTQMPDGSWIVSRPHEVVTYKDGVKNLSAHQSGKAVDLYLVETITTVSEGGVQTTKVRVKYEWDKETAEKWHKRWEEMGGRPVFRNSLGEPWDLNHFEG